MQDEVTHQGHTEIHSVSGLLALSRRLLQGVLVASDRKLNSKGLCPKETDWLKNPPVGVPLWGSWLRVQRCHCSGLGRCCGVGSIPGLETSTCLGCSQIKKKKNPMLHARLDPGSQCHYALLSPCVCLFRRGFNSQALRGSKMPPATPGLRPEGQVQQGRFSSPSPAIRTQVLGLTPSVQLGAQPHFLNARTGLGGVGTNRLGLGPGLPLQEGEDVFLDEVGAASPRPATSGRLPALHRLPPRLCQHLLCVLPSQSLAFKI